AEALAAARDFVAVNGSLEQARLALQATMRQMAYLVATQSGQNPARVREIFDSVLAPEFEARLPEMVDIAAAAWASHMSADELRALAAFYRSPLGERLKQATPQVTADSMAFGARWGEQVGREAVAKHRLELRARGLKI
ncbi:DUF2059 domain-containing protein, partial [Roseomonas sp. GC11]|uniref:DUF2059 domain-containing protein n=1 Tax=Roseomonas sp. GC11 TaxID=2950546 RepID=UPI00210BE78D